MNWKKFNCPACGQSIEAESAAISQGVNCPTCNTGFVPSIKASREKTETVIMAILAAGSFAARFILHVSDIAEKNLNSAALASIILQVVFIYSLVKLIWLGRHWLNARTGSIIFWIGIAVMLLAWWSGSLIGAIVGGFVSLIGAGDYALRSLRARQ